MQLKEILDQKNHSKISEKSVFNSFDMLVSNNIKKMAERKDKRKPKGNAAKYSDINLLLF